MATTVFMLTCTLAEGFLLYTLTQFARELRKARAARPLAAVIPISCATGENASEDQELGRVIEITYGNRVPAQTSGRRLAS
jgi:hypothetical protein